MYLYQCRQTQIQGERDWMSEHPALVRFGGRGFACICRFVCTFSRKIPSVGPQYILPPTHTRKQLHGEDTHTLPRGNNFCKKKKESSHQKSIPAHQSLAHLHTNQSSPLLNVPSMRRREICCERVLHLPENRISINHQLP